MFREYERQKRIEQTLDTLTGVLIWVLALPINLCLLALAAVLVAVFVPLGIVVKGFRWVRAYAGGAFVSKKMQS